MSGSRTPTVPSPTAETRQFKVTDIESLRGVFSLFDKDNTGTILAQDLEAVFLNVGRDPALASQMLFQLGVDLEHARVSFDDFFQLLVRADQQTEENGLQDIPHFGSPEPDPKVMEFLRLLDEYRKKCEKEGNYIEARKAKFKYEELRAREEYRQKAAIKSGQEQELHNVELAQKMQFLEFSAAWDKYMADYEATAYLSLEKLKERHQQMLQEFQETTRRQLTMKVKFSKELLALRHQEIALAKQKKYVEAQKIKSRADNMEKWELAKMDTEIEETINRKEAKLRHQHQLALQALLKRIQRDRQEQIKHRQADSQRLIQRNKNIRNDLVMKQTIEAKKANLTIRQSLHSSMMADLTVPSSPGSSLPKPFARTHSPTDGDRFSKTGPAAQRPESNGGRMRHTFPNIGVR